MSAPFEPGDVVTCWRLPEGPYPGPFVYVGGVYRIYDCECGPHGWGVNLEGDPTYDPDLDYEAAAFRKIDDEVCEEFREQLRAIGKPRVLEPASGTPTRSAETEGLGPKDGGPAPAGGDAHAD